MLNTLYIVDAQEMFGISELLSLFLLTISKKTMACDAPPDIPNLDMNITTVDYKYIPGTVLQFKCNSTSELDQRRDTERVTMVCLDNNTWTIHGAELCKPEKCYIAAAILLTSLVLAVSGAVSYILTMSVIGEACIIQ